MLHLEAGVREHFDGFLAAEAPDLLPLYRRLYPGTRVRAGVEQSLGAVVGDLRQRYGLSDRPVEAPKLRGPATEASMPLSRAGVEAQLKLGL